MSVEGLLSCPELHLHLTSFVIVRFTGFIFLQYHLQSVYTIKW